MASKKVVIGIAVVLAVVLVALVLAAVVAVAVVFSVRDDDDDFNGQPGAAVSIDSTLCAEMAADILRRDGSAVDAAITGMLCSGVVQPISSGIGGGGFMTIRLRNGSVYALNFREAAPLAADENILNGSSTLKGLTVGVPGEVRGMERAHQLFGKLSWKELFDPVVALARNGFNLTDFAATRTARVWDRLPESIRIPYRNANGSIKVAGDFIAFPELADTLEAISRGGADAFYTDGRIAQSIVDTVNASGGIMTLEDLRTYTVKLEEPLRTQYNGHTFYSLPSPSGGPAFLFMLSLMDLYRHNSTSDRSLLYHRLVEAFKFAFAERTRLADPFCNDPECESDSREILESQRRLFNETYVSEIWSRISDEQTYNLTYYNPRFSPTPDAGTSHLSILVPNGDAVSVTTTVNFFYGAKIITDTGIVLNNEMDDFSSPGISSGPLPPSNVNFVRPGKRPLSSTCPTIAVMETERGPQVSMVIGAAGGRQIPTSTVQAVVRTLTLEQPLMEAIEFPRLHHQLIPESVRHDESFPQEILTFLEARGHALVEDAITAVVEGIHVDESGCVSAHSDSLKGGMGIVLNQEEECSNPQAGL